MRACSHTHWHHSQCCFRVSSTLSCGFAVVRVLPSRWSGHGLLGMSVWPVWIDDEAEETEVSSAAEADAAAAAGYALPYAMRARQDVLRVTEVLPGGPASLARLSADGDVLLGADGAVFATVEGFGSHIAKQRDNVVTLHVFNSTRRTVRDVPVFVTSREWGPEGGRRSGLGLALSGGLMSQVPLLRSPPRNEWAIPPHRRHRKGSAERLRVPQSASAEIRAVPRTSTAAAGASTAKAVPATAPSTGTARSRLGNAAQEAEAGVFITTGDDDDAGTVAETARALFAEESSLSPMRHPNVRNSANARETSTSSQTLTPIVGPHNWAAATTGSTAAASPVAEPEV